jgi:hypothetical protein
VVGDIDEDPASPDGNWLTLGDDGTDCDFAVSFPTPTGDLNTGAGLQTFRIWARIGTAAGGNDPTWDMAVRESGGADLASVTAQAITSHSGEMITFTWDATVLATISGANVELRFLGTRSGGGPSVRRCIEIGAVEWIADYSAGAVTNFQTVAATSTVTPSLTRVTTWVETLAATSTVTAGLTQLRTFYRTLAVTSPVTAVLARLNTFYRTLATSSTVTAALSTVTTRYRTLAASSTVSAGLAEAYLAVRTLAATTTAAANLVTQFIAASVVTKLFNRSIASVGSLLRTRKP